MSTAPPTTTAPPAGLGLESGELEQSRRARSAKSVVLTKARRADRFVWKNIFFFFFFFMTIFSFLLLFSFFLSSSLLKKRKNISRDFNHFNHRNKAALSALHYKQIQGEEPPFFLKPGEEEEEENLGLTEEGEKPTEETKEEGGDEEKKGEESPDDKGKEKEKKKEDKDKKKKSAYDSFYLARNFQSIHSHEGFFFPFFLSSPFPKKKRKKKLFKILTKKNPLPLPFLSLPLPTPPGSGVLCIIKTQDVHWVSFSNGRISIFDNHEFKEIFTLSAPLKERAYVLLVEDGFVYMISEQGKVAVWTEVLFFLFFPFIFFFSSIFFVFSFSFFYFCWPKTQKKKQVDRKLEGFFRTSHSHIVKSALFLNGRLWTADVGGVVLVCTIWDTYN